MKIKGPMMDSEAWKALTPYARCLYIVLKRRHRNYARGKNNNGRIPLSRREAALETGFSESAIGNAFRDLISKRFIKITRESAFSMKDTRAREYALSELPHGDKAATHEYMRWEPNKKQNTGGPETPDRCAGNTRDPNSKTPKTHTVRSTGAPETPVKKGNGCAGRTTINNHRGRA